MNPPVAVTARGKFAVKNLAWLLAHLSHNRVLWLNAQPLPRVDMGDPAAVLTVAFVNGDMFQSDFASYSVCLDFISRRRALKGIPVRRDHLPVIALAQEHE